ADVQLVCSDGTTPTSLPACSSDPLTSLVVTANLTLATTPQPLQGNGDLTRCRVEGGVVICGVTVRSQFYQPASDWAATLTFASGKTLTSSPFEFNAVATPPILPADLKQRMGVPASEQVVAGATSSVVEFEQQYYSPSDLAQFYAAVGVPVSNVNQVTVIGYNNASLPGGEAALDIEMLGAVAENSPITFWSVFANSTVEIDDILKWAIAVANMTNPPSVNSLSYGMSEANVNEYLGKGYLQRSDVEFAKLAALGLTVIIASGDTGAGDLGFGPMSQPTCTTLHADWPSQSPFVTSVGSTYLTPLAEPACYGAVDCSNGPLGEVGVSVDFGLFWSSGGGFSNRSISGSGRAWYQKAAVQSYLDSAVLPPAHAFDALGRGYPDAVAIGHNLMTVLNGTFIPIDGTSASAPIFAGLITLLNDQRLRVGKKALGLLNPLLYKLAEIAPDTSFPVLVGNNRCGAYGFSPVCCDWGYPAAPGWSPVGGVGSPNYAALKREVLLLP
ncbi:MAG: S53 family peptidase, partial [Myxococcales bacterium]|nr:S53 family peptidase [Myxococcales bacterium]